MSQQVKSSNFNLWVFATTIMILGIVDLVPSIIAGECIKTNPSYSEEYPLSQGYISFTFFSGLYVILIAITISVLLSSGAV